MDSEGEMLLVGSLWPLLLPSYMAMGDSWYLFGECRCPVLAKILGSLILHQSSKSVTKGRGEFS